MSSISQPYASRYSHVLSLVEAHLLEARKHRQELPKSRFTAGLAEGRKRDGRDGFWAVLDHMANIGSDLKNVLPCPADFRVSATLGSGRFGTVEVVRSNYDGELYAMKSISKTAIRRSSTTSSLGIERQVHLLATRQASWVPVPGLHAAFLSSESLHLVLHLAMCGSLWDRMGIEDEPFPFASPRRGAEQDQARVMGTDEVRWWASQMVEAIAWLHDQGYAHRDIKPQNFLIDASARILLTDFGVSAPLNLSEVRNGCAYVSDDYCAVPAGTPDYIAPEVLLAGEAAIAATWSETAQSSPATRYTTAVDHWSLGATIFEMAAGQAPFYSRSVAGTYARISSNDVDLSVLATQNADPALRDIIAGLLCPAHQRLGVSQLRQHAFFYGTDWAGIRNGTAAPPTTLPHLTPRGLDAETSLSQSNGFSFSMAQFNYTSPTTNIGDFTQFTQPLEDPNGWIGWTWMPDPADLAGAGHVSLAYRSPVKQVEVDDRFRTPKRQTSAHDSRPPPSTAKRVPKKTPSSNPYFDLLKCVHESAKKKQRTPLRSIDQQKGEDISIDSVERDVSKLIDNLQSLRARLKDINK